MEKEEKKHRTDFTIYLAKPEFSISSGIIKNEDTLKSVPISIGKQNIGTLFIKAPYFNPPRWAKYFSAVITEDEFGCNASTAAVLLVESDKRLFILTFGHGHHLVNSEFIEMNFGLRIALNTLNVDSLRSIDKATFEAHPTQSREQSGKATALQYFGIDVERDLLRALTGIPKDKSYGERLSGMDAVKLSVPIDLPDLKDFLSRLLIAYEDDSYKKGFFSWVDHIGLIKDIRQIELLDQQLIAKIAANEIDKIWLSVPEIIDWNRVVGFKYAKSKNATRYYDIRIPEFIEALNNVEINKELLLRKKILCVDADDVPVLERPSYYFIYAELMLDAKIYLLNNGKWYLINQDFTKQIDTFYSNIKFYEKTLPAYDDETEGHYNIRVAKENPDKYFLFHGKNIYLSGQVAPIEPCDLYSCDREFIHIKRYGGSSVLSHLFNQGLVSSELFQRESNYRLQLNDKLSQKYKLPDVSERLAPEKYTIVYAIISEYDEDLSLPFFSKISLRHAVNRLESIGFKVKLAKIPVAVNKKKIKKCPTKKVKF